MGTLFANGSLGNVSVSAGGTATVYLDDVNGSVSVDLAGVSNVVVGAASGLLQTCQDRARLSVFGLCCATSSSIIFGEM